MNYILTLVAILLSLTLSSTTAANRPPPGLWGTLEKLRKKKFVDLTHAFEPGIPHFPGFPDEKRTTIYNYSSGFLVHSYKHVGQWGTHVDPPSHFHEGKKSLDLIPVKEMVLPLVLDVSAKVAASPDYTVTLNDLKAWEKRNGRVPKGAFVALRTDWSKRWPDASVMRNADVNGTAHYPGWSLAVLKALYADRKITGNGHETTDTDPGIATSSNDYSLESYVLGRYRWQIELLCCLDKVPEAGAIAVVTWPKPKGGSGFPARVFAILP
jgi:kynurenine formamidase